MFSLAIHPGFYLRDMSATRINRRRFARLLGISEPELVGLMNGMLDVDGPLAQRIAVATGTRPEFWLSMQQAHNMTRRTSKGRLPSDNRDTETRSIS